MKFKHSLNVLLCFSLILLTSMHIACSQTLAVPPAELNDITDAGPAVTASDSRVVQLDTLTAEQRKAFPVLQQTFNHALGGGVRGFGMLAQFGKTGPGKVLIKRSTNNSRSEPYTPICIAKVVSPQGDQLAVIELTEQKARQQSYILTVPSAGPGIYRVSIMGGRNGDLFTIGLPRTDIWGVRGEMALGISDTTPVKPYLYTPSTVQTIILEQFGKTDKPITISNTQGKVLVTTARNKQGRYMIDTDAPADTVLQLDLRDRQGAAFIMDGVPALLCPTEKAARTLAGGTVEADGFLVAGPLQARVRKWMASRQPTDFEVNVEHPTTVPEKIDDPMRECLMFGKYATLSTIGDQLAHQIIDKNDPYMGATEKVAIRPQGKPPVDWRTFLHGGVRSFGDASGLAAVATTPSQFNVYHDNPAIINRAILSSFYHFVSMQGDDLMREGTFRSNNYPLTHVFFSYDGAMANPLVLLKDKLDKETYALWREALIAAGDKIADYQAYQSNQWQHMILGHLNTYLATGEKRFLGYFERQARAFLTGAYGRNAKFGQHPTGYYLEQYGPDGNYDHLNQYCIVTAYMAYRQLKEADPELVKLYHDGIQKNLELKRFYWLQQPDNGMACPNAFDCRTTALLSHPSYPGDYLAKGMFDLAYTRWAMVRTPEGSAGAALIMPHQANNPQWAKLQVRTMLPRGPRAFDRPSMSGGWTPHIMEAYFEQPEKPKMVTLPCDGPDNTWELPGHIAFKRGKLFGTVFYAVDGRDSHANLQGKFGGGPTVLWARDFGMVIGSMMNTKRNKIDDENDLTRSCVFGTIQKSKHFYSGDEVPTLKWTVPGKTFQLTSSLRKPRGELIWQYTLEDNAVIVSAAIDSNMMSEGWINLPLYTEAADLQATLISPQTLEIKNGDAVMQMTSLNGQPLKLTDPRATTHKNVQCLQIPLSNHGDFAGVRIEQIR